MKITPKKMVYLDNAASTQPQKAVLKAIKPFLEGYFGNPSSSHDYGRNAREALDLARQKVANILGASPKEVIFTAGGTESINLAIFGVAKAYQTVHKKPGHVIVSSIEHESVLECAKQLKRQGWKVDYLKVDPQGVIDIEELKHKIRKDTVLISVMYANNEIGTIEPITEIGKVITGTNRSRNKQNLSPIYFHTDACQAGGVLDLDVNKLKVDLLTLNGSKIRGPKGSGILFIRTGVNIEPIIYGGGQERGLRSGTENTPAIIGFATALELSQKSRKTNAQKLLALQLFLESGLKKNKLITINGAKNKKFRSNDFNFGLTKLPGTINFSVKGVEGEALMYYLNGAGFAVATGSACTTGSEDPSHVLLAIGLNNKLSKSSIRISLGTDITKDNLKQFLKALTDSIKTIQNTTQDL